MTARSTRSPSLRSRRDPRALAAGIAAALACCGACGSGGNAPAGNESAAAPGPAPEVRVLLDQVALEPPSWSPDGSLLVVDDRETLGLRIVPAAGGEARPLTADPFHNDADWSPVGDRIVFVDKNRGGLFAIPATAGEAEPVPLVRGPVEGFPAPWSPDGTRLVLRRGPGLDLLDVASGAIREIVPVAAGESPVAASRWSFDGRRVVVQRVREILNVDLERGETEVLPVSGRDPAFGADDRIWLIGADEDRALVRWRKGSAETLSDLRGPVTSFDVHAPSGRLAVAVRGRGLVLRDADGRNEIPITFDPGDHSPRWSPNGRSVAFVRQGAGGATLCVVELGGQIP